MLVEPKLKDSIPRLNVNKYFKENLKGELSDEQARITLGEFLNYNIQFTTRLLTGIILKPYQALMIKGWMEKNFSLACWGRAAAKTLLYNDETQLLTEEHGLISLTHLIPNLSFDFEGWRQIPLVHLWNGKSWQKTDKIYVQPKKNCRTIYTNRGYYLGGSINHLIKVWNEQTCQVEWKRYSEIKLGDWICISRDKNCNWSHKNGETSKDFDEAYLIGLLIGDGCYSSSQQNKFSFVSMDEELLKFIENYPCGKRVDKQLTNAKTISLTKDFSNYLFKKYNISQSLSYNKVIPDYILNSKNLLRHCLSGLFDTDGTVSERGQVSFATTSKLLAKQVHNSLLLFGVISSLNEYKTTSPFGKVWEIDICGYDADKFKHNINFRLSRKKTRLAAKCVSQHSNVDVIPGIKEYCQREIKAKYTKLTGWDEETNEKWRNNIRRKSNQRHLTYQSLGKYINFFEKANIKENDLFHLKNIIDENFYFDPVVKIEDSIENCLDFNVPNGEQYWSNGFINHNSTMAGLFSVLYAINNPGVRILIVSSNFRSSRRILENIETLSKKKDGILLRQVFDGDLSRRTDIFQWSLKNGSTIACLPLANGEGLRGQRANVLIIDEALLVPKHIIENILKPFLAAAGDITEKLKIREIEDDLIKKGLMKEEERRKFKSQSKMILLSSASYQGEYFHEVYCQYLKNISEGLREDSAIEDATYFVSQLSYEVVQQLAPDLFDKGIIQEIEGGNTPQSVIDREYRAQFIQDSDGFYRAKRMAACTIPDGQRPTIEIVGEPDAEYILAIDPNVGGDETNDHFAMSLLKIVTKKDGRKIGMLVHSYAAAGVDLKDHIEYFTYLLEKFNIVYIAIDSTQGENLDFISICNESEIFKQKKINLLSIDAEFAKEDQSEITKQIKKSYDLKTKRIVQKQRFHSSFQSAANDHLQACVDFGNIIFAGKALSVDGQTDLLLDQDIGTIHQTHKLFNNEKEGNPIYQFIERQDYLIDLTKAEMALIRISVSSLGTKSFDIPLNFKRLKSANRPRKDNYSSLLLANWALKLYIEMLSLPDEGNGELSIFQFIA